MSRTWPYFAAAVLYGSLWLSFGLAAATWFSIGAVTASFAIAYEIGARKRAHPNPSEKE